MEEDYLLPYADPLADDYSTVLDQPVGAGTYRAQPDDDLINALILSLAGKDKAPTSDYRASIPEYAPAPQQPMERRYSRQNRVRSFNSGEHLGFYDSFGKFHPGEYPAGVGIAGKLPISTPRMSNYTGSTQGFNQFSDYGRKLKELLKAYPDLWREMIQ